MPECPVHGFYVPGAEGRCPKCVRDYIAERSNEMSGKRPLGYCKEHGYYYAKYRGLYDGCPVCARNEHG